MTDWTDWQYKLTDRWLWDLRVYYELLWDKIVRFIISLTVFKLYTTVKLFEKDSEMTGKETWDDGKGTWDGWLQLYCPFDCNIAE